MNYSVIRHASTSLTLPTQSDVMSPRASMGSNNREVILKFVLNNKWTSRHHIQPIDRAPSLDVIKKDIKFVGDRNAEGLPVVWNEAKLDLMARNALNQINSCIANFKDPLRHSSIDESEVIDVRDDEVLEHKALAPMRPESQEGWWKYLGTTVDGNEIRTRIKPITANYSGSITFVTDTNSIKNVYGMLSKMGDKQWYTEAKKELEYQGRKFTDEDIQKYATDLKNAILKSINPNVNVVGRPSNPKTSAPKTYNNHAGYYSPNLEGGSNSSTQYPRPRRRRYSSNGAGVHIRHSYDVIWSDDPEDALCHYGIEGQRWGVRRFQNADGSLTPEGRIHYGVKYAKATVKGNPKAYRKAQSKIQTGEDDDLLESVSDIINQRHLRPNARNVEKILKELKPEPSAAVKKEVADIVRNANFDEDVSVKVFQKTGADLKAVDDAYAEIEKYTETERKIEKEVNNILKPLNNKQIRTEYEAVSEIASDSIYFHKDVNEMTLNDIGNSAFMGVWEDGQQQAVNARSLCANKTGNADRIIELSKESSEAYKECNQKTTQILDDALKEVGSNTINISHVKDDGKYSNPDYTMAKGLSFHMMNQAEKDTGVHNYNLHASAHKFTDQESKACDDVFGIVKNVAHKGAMSTWWFFNTAVENLGMSDEKASGLSSSDWAKINEEISNLRRTSPSWLQDIYEY